MADEVRVRQGVCRAFGVAFHWGVIDLDKSNFASAHLVVESVGKGVDVVANTWAEGGGS